MREIWVSEGFLGISVGIREKIPIRYLSRMQCEGRMIVFKLNDGTWKRLMKNFSNETETERDLIESARKLYQERYNGAYDLYRFSLRCGEILEITSKFSYENIWKMWTERGGKIGKDGYVAWGFKFKKDDEEWNKQVMIISLLLGFNKNGTLGSGDSELDKNLAHDHILTSLARLDADVKKNRRKKIDDLSTIERLIEQYDLPKIEADKFKKIIDSL
jgi:hypothetical protein